jgi:hypothetical protein
MCSKYYLTFALLFSTSVLLLESAQAQWIYTPVFPDQCGYKEARCRRDSSGNIVDKKTGDVYDRKGKFLRRGNKTGNKKCKYVKGSDYRYYLKCR